MKDGHVDLRYSSAMLLVFVTGISAIFGDPITPTGVLALFSNQRYASQTITRSFGASGFALQTLLFIAMASPWLTA